ncbi:putative serine/threonine-protein kinase-like [Capsicum annuum]|nr:putative serine/threonine-protein kinase-like [Capsicum annuum]KAF3669021.1 putative serine/threonine-protein kinase-like [Capsicum annuum]
MITRSNLAEQLREYQIRSKHDWASLSFFSSTSNLTSTATSCENAFPCTSFDEVDKCVFFLVFFQSCSLKLLKPFWQRYETLAVDGFRRGRGRPKKYWREVIRHDMEQLQPTEDVTLDRKLLPDVTFVEALSSISSRNSLVLNNIATRADVVIFVICELIILALLVFSVVSLYFSHLKLAFILVTGSLLLHVCVTLAKQVTEARMKKRRMLLPLSM